MRTLRAAIFDLDGTLIDSSRDIWEAFRHAARQASLRPPALEEVAPLVGRPLREMFEALWGELGEPEVARLADAYRAHYRANLGTHTRPYPGARRMLAQLRPMHLAVATTKRTPMANLALERVGLLALFDHVQGTDGFPAKPAPDVLVHAARALALPAAACIYSGDGTWDMEAAVRAGMLALGIAHGGTGADALRAAGAIRVARSLPELAAAIAELSQGTT